ncbi:MAG: hypothetical protein RIC55_03540 [Pirellulaceae bacterium]
MIRTPLLAAFAVSALIGRAEAEQPPRPFDLRGEWIAVDLPPAFPESAVWKAELDSKLDGQLEATTSQTLVLDSASGRIIGRPRDRGRERAEHSLFTGQVIVGSPPVVSLRQDEQSGYTAVYSGRLVAKGRIVGSYVDNQGAAGDWSLTLVSDIVIRPLAKQLPDEQFFESVLGVYGRAIRGERHPYINLRPPHRDLWTAEIQEVVNRTLRYEEVDYLGAAKLVIPETGSYTVEIPGAGVEVRINGQRIEAGDLELEDGLYIVEIYTNHWGQPYLTYADVTVHKKDDEQRIPFVNTASDIRAFRARKIDGRRVIEVNDYKPPRFEVR